MIKGKSTCPAGYIAAGFKTPIRLNKEQEAYCQRAVNVARFAYNYCLGRLYEALETKSAKWPSGMELSKEFTEMKKRDKYAWLNGVAAKVVVGACNLSYASALAKWRQNGYKSGKPRFKKKKAGKQSFVADFGVESIKVLNARRIQLVRIGSLRLNAVLRKDFIPYQAIITYENGRWYLSLNCWRPLPQQTKAKKAVGVDVGINPVAHTSNNDVYRLPDGIKKEEDALSYWHRRQSKRIKGSKRWRVAQSRIEKTHRRIKGLRDNFHHRISNELTKNNSLIGIESLNIKGMFGLRSNAKALGRAGMSNLLRMIGYKAGWRGCALVEASRFYPSSKKCHVCRVVNGDLKRQPSWVCTNCQTLHDRNRNAACNLLNIALGREAPSKLAEGVATGVKLLALSNPVEAGTPTKANV